VGLISSATVNSILVLVLNWNFATASS